MLQNIVHSINTVGPVLLLVLLGRYLRSRGLIDEPFIQKANKLAYGYSLPMSLFVSNYTADPGQATNLKLCVYVVASIFAVCFLLMAVVPRFIRDRRHCGAFVQASFRSNFAILGVTMAIQLFGETGAQATIMLVPVVVIPFTICTILVFTVFSPDENAKLQPLQLARKIITNPLICGSLLGILLRTLAVPVPAACMSAVEYVAALATPLALIAIGGQAEPEGSAEVGLSADVLTCCALKLMVVPAVVLVPALFMGFAPAELGAIFLAHCSPTGVSSYAMSAGMNSDYRFTGKVITLSTVFSFVTIFVGILLLRSFHVIQ